MAKYELTKEAVDDLYLIWEYTNETWSERMADRYYAGLVSAFQFIASKSSVGRPYDEIFPGLRGFRKSHHIIFYTVQSSGNILIVRVLHEMMDFKRHL